MSTTVLQQRVLPGKVPGIYLWTDCGYMQGYRLQAHYSQRVYRLLDARGQRLLSGTREDCQTRLDELTASQGLSLPTGPVIVLLHGMARNAWTMGSLARYLYQHWPEAEVINFQYASTCAAVVTHAERLIEFLRYAEHASELHIVGHSLGNIVTRRAFKLVEQGLATMPRVSRMVMLGPPNQGSQIARKLKGLLPLVWFNGVPFMQVGRDWQQFCAELATPPCPFGVIAGSVPWAHAIHPLIREASDMIVSVEEMRLDGAADFLTIPIGHAWYMSSRRVQQATLNFLKTGRFTSDSIA